MNGSGRIIGVSMILASVCFEAAGQLALKAAADRRATALVSALAWMVGGWITLIIDGLLWSAALYYLDVSVAHPMGSVVFVMVAVFSHLFLHERITGRRWIGISLILAGSTLVAFN
jgi:drug/metabolite transporter (DMT)-like permease